MTPSPPPGVDWEALRRAVAPRIAADTAAYRSTAGVLGGVSLLLLFLAPPYGIGLLVLTVVYLGGVVGRNARAAPVVLWGPVAGKRMPEKSYDPREYTPAEGDDEGVVHLRRYLLTLHPELRLALRPGGAVATAGAGDAVTALVTPELYDAVEPGRRVGLILSPANDLMGYLDETGRWTLLEESVDQSRKRGGWRLRPG